MVRSTSTEEAQASVERLAAMMTQLLQSNEDMSHRMANMELRTKSYLPSRTQTTSDALRPRMASCRNSNKDRESMVTIQQVKPYGSCEQDNSLLRFDHSFDLDLKNSRPYTRASKRPPIWSVASSAVQTLSWSCFSGLSLADMSQISVINLPITQRELWNGHSYSVYSVHEKGLDDVVEEEPRSCSVSPELSRSSGKNRSSSLLNIRRFLRSPSPTTTFQQRRCAIHVQNNEPQASTAPKSIAILGNCLHPC